MSAVGLAALPDEIVLDALQYNCGVETWVSLALTCRRLSQWLEERIFWISALRATKRLRPIACSFHRDLTKCTLQELKEIAWLTIRVKRNWSVPCPRPVACRKVNVQGASRPDMLDIIFQIPATHLYLLHDRGMEQLAVWDMGVGRMVTEPVVGFPLIEDVSAGIDEPGKYSIAMLIQMDDISNRRIALAVVRYGDLSREVTLCVPFQKDLPSTDAPHPGYWDIFATGEVVGVMTGSLDLRNLVAPYNDFLCVLAFNTVSKVQTAIVTDLDMKNLVASTGEGDTGSTISGEDLFFLYDAGEASLACRIPGSLLPKDSTRSYPEKVQFNCAGNREFSRTTNHTLVRDASDPFWSSTAQGLLSTGPYYEVPALSIRKQTYLEHIDDDGPSQTDVVQGDEDVTARRYRVEHALDVRFWGTDWVSDHPVNGFGENGGSDKEIGERYHTLTPHSSPHLYGDIYERDDTAWKLILLTPSGRVMAAFVQPVVGGPDVSPQLALALFDLERRRSTVHVLELPKELSLKDVRGFAVDDHCGVVTLQGDTGSWFLVSYA
ncbi:hypothetical protein NMY22_g4679 [Coprinellus aureogranulatus]|nr:hypothetical protein NMY22_g4679 [Coprinellus aureogranulatus]